MTMGLLGLLVGCQGCRVGGSDSGDTTVADTEELILDLGEVWLGGEVARRLPVPSGELTSADNVSPPPGAAGATCAGPPPRPALWS